VTGPSSEVTIKKLIDLGPVIRFDLLDEDMIGSRKSALLNPEMLSKYDDEGLVLDGKVTLAIDPRSVLLRFLPGSGLPRQFVPGLDPLLEPCGRGRAYPW
jgi:hypothetical protein